MLYEVKVNTLKMDGKVGALCREINTIKKNQMENLDLENITSEVEKFTV